MSKFYEGLAEIFEVDESQIATQFDLRSAEMPWDSLAIVSTIALVDDCFGVMLGGVELTECNTVGDIEALIEKARQA
jgi:acyl carrier protein